MLSKKSPFYKVSTILSFLLLLSACSNSGHNSSNNADANATSSIQNNKTVDTFENVNRKIFSFNEKIDNLLLKPTAKAYKAVTPKFVDTTIGNFFGNLGDVGNAINNTLQGKFSDAASDTERFVFNSIFGFAGLVDVASAAGIQKHDEDFGQTLAKWGVKSGPYVMLPFLGPSTVRDATAKVSVDRFTDPAHYTDENIALFITETVKKRSDFLAQEEVVKGLSDDTYSALRDVWLQNRDFLIRDGVADESAGSDLIDELESLDLE